MMEETIEKEFEEVIVNIGRVTKVVKGGRRFRFTALVVIGDRNGTVGYGFGKAKEVPDAIKKAVDDAHKNLVKVNIKGTTIAHELNTNSTQVESCSDQRVKVQVLSPVVLLEQVLFELAGVKDVLSKSIGSNNPNNLVRATIQALTRIKASGVEYGFT